MAEYSISDAAKQANISVRTLHHYDNIGLLRPSVRAQSGYRFYTDENLERLHDILFYRALGFSLKRIATVLEETPDNRLSILRDQQIELNAHIERLQAMKRQLEDTLQTQEATMSNNDRLNALKGFDPDQYEQETKEQWGNTDAYKESARRTRSYSDEDWARYKQEFNALNQEMAAIMSAGKTAESDDAIAVAEKMRVQIDTWFYPCSRETHAQLGEMYVADERFTKTYDDVKPGLAAFIQRATVANLA